MKPNTLSSLVALALAGSAWAASPYDTAYGLQWNFQIGTTVQDAFQTQTAVTSDGTVFVTNRTGAATWGAGTTGSVCGGVGAISPLGKLIYGHTLRLPSMSNYGQNYLTGVNAVGNTAYIGINGSGSQYWIGQDTSDNNRVMTFSLDSSGLGSIANMRRLTKYKDAVGTLRTDGLGPILPGGGLNQPAQNRSADSAVRASTLDMIIVGNSNSEFAFAGDYGGSNYGCFVGRYNFSTNTLTGPEKQPVAYDGASAIVRGDYTRAGVDQATGRYYAAGVPNAAGATVDPDGTGPIAPFAVDSSASTNGFVVAYDPATPPSPDTIAYTVLWDSPTVGTTSERINAIAPTNDGTNSVFLAGYTTGDMPGFIGTNANPTVNSDSYLELRDATGALVWSDQLALSPLSDGITAAEILANGDLMVTGYKDGATAGIRDSWVRKYKKTGPGTYVVAWTSDIVNALDPTNTKNDQVQDSAFESTGDAVYLTVQSLSQWNNTTGHIVTGTNDDILMHKLTPGDFNTDGLVDFADVQLAGTATKPGLTGVDTYDFNRDGDSTLADTIYMITNIMDRALGDIAQDALVTDVDNADIGKAIGTLGSGTLYLDGDIDFDGDVDAADITAVAGAFTGAKTPGKWTNGSVGATLTYSPDDGQVWISASEAAGGIITSFQLENAAGTFVPAGYAGPAGGSFGGALEDATTHVIADTDLTFTGFSGVTSLGTIFPTKMDQAALEAYLTTAVYTGQPGSGQMRFKPVVVVLPADYEAWVASFPNLTDPDPALDFDGDGLATGVEFVLGGDPTLNDAAAVAPTAGYNGSDLTFTFRRTDLANNDPVAAMVAEYGSDLAAWTQAQSGVDGVTIVENDNFYGPGIDQVIVSLPPNLAVNGRIFARLKVTITLPQTLLDEDFETDDGSFTIVTAGGTPWAYGDPESTGGGGNVTTGNGDSAKCWGTNLVGTYAAGTDTALRSPVIDLTGAAGATLSFAMAMDAAPGHTLEVNVVDATTLVKTTVIAPFEDPDIDTTPWKTMSAAIPAAALGTTVYLEWRFVGAGNDSYLGAYIDDVVVTVP